MDRSLKIKDLHAGFADPKANEMYRNVYGFLCSMAHPSILSAKSNQVLRLYFIHGRLLSLDDAHEDIRQIFLELFFNYYLWMVLRNTINLFLIERGSRVPLVRYILENHHEELFPDSLLEELKQWNVQFPTLSKFMDEIQEMISKYKNKAIPVKSVEDLNSRIEGIYELKEYPKLIAHFKKIVTEKYSKLD